MANFLIARFIIHKNILKSNVVSEAFLRKFFCRACFCVSLDVIKNAMYAIRSFLSITSPIKGTNG